MVFNSIETEWQRFFAFVFPDAVNKPVPQTQHDEMKKAFFAGAWVMVNAIYAADSSEVTEEMFAAWAVSVHAECMEFKEKLFKEYLEGN